MKGLELKQKTCCFTGHRDLPAGEISGVQYCTANAIRFLVKNKGICFFGVGGAIGYDTLAADILFQLRETEFPNIKIILVYPFEGFYSKWSNKQRAEYERLLPRYDKRVCLSQYAKKGAYLARNRHLVDHSSYCIAYCTRNYGGTAYTVDYALQHGVEVINFESHKKRALSGS